MKFEYKLLLTMFIVSVFILTTVNVLVLLQMKSATENLVLDFVHTYTLNSKRLPNYILMSDKPVYNSKYFFVGKTQNKYVYIYKEKVFTLIKSTAINILVWETVLLIFVFYLFNVLILRNVENERNKRELVELMLFAITHKLGNFLSSVKLNLEMLKRKIGENTNIFRIEKELEDIEYSYTKTVNILRLLSKVDVNKEKVNISDIIRELIMTKFSDKVLLSLKPQAIVNTNKLYVEVLLSNLLENAIKYSREFVHIKVCSSKYGVSIFIRNDIGHVSGGTGLGLKIAKYIAGRLGIEMRVRIKRRFMVALRFK